VYCFALGSSDVTDPVRVRNERLTALQVATLTREP